MKLIVFMLLSLSLTQNFFTQTFTGLKGFEDVSGNTHLFYNIYQNYQGGGSTDNLYHLDINNNVDTIFYYGYTDPIFLYGEGIITYDFWNLNPDKYVYAIYIYDYPNLEFKYLYRSDYLYPIYSIWMEDLSHIYISKQDTSVVVLNASHVIISTDGGFNWSQGADFNFVAMNPFNDNTLFGTKYHFLVKSIDRGSSYYTVDTADYWDYGYNSVYFDQDAQHIYGIFNWPSENRLKTSKLLVSNNNGEAYSWNLNTEFEGPVNFTFDPAASGNIYLANYNSIYHSSDYGSSFSLFHHFDERIVGIYKKPATEKLYIATRYHLYELGNNTFTVLKELNANPDLVKYYPLAVGDFWVYYGSVWDQRGSYGYTYIRKINSQVIKPNQKLYFEVEEYEVGSTFHFTFYERIDTLSAKVYRFNEDSVQTNQEYLIDDLRAELGDSLITSRFMPDAPFSMSYYSDTTFFQINSKTKTFELNSLISYRYKLIQNFGLTYVLNTYDFGSDTRLFKGAVINGTVYGDTTVTGIHDITKPAVAFSLSQNYPNPFNPTTTIQYSVGSLPVAKAGTQFVSLKVYDVLGNEVATLVNEEKPSGNYSVKFDGSKFASGIYFYQLKAGTFFQTRKMIFLK